MISLVLLFVLQAVGASTEVEASGLQAVSVW